MDTVCSVQPAISKANGISIKRIMFNVIFISFGSLIQYLREHCDHSYSSVFRDSERSPWILVFHFMKALENVFKRVSSLAHLLLCVCVYLQSFGFVAVHIFQVMIISFCYVFSKKFQWMKFIASSWMFSKWK